eukprot:tig00020806_g14036.t1
MAARRSVVELYREFIARGKLHATPGPVLEQIRNGFREHLHETDPAKVQELVNNAQSRLRFLRMVTPKPVSRSRSQAGADGLGRTTYVFKDGQLVEGEGSGLTAAAITGEDAARMELKSQARAAYRTFQQGRAKAAVSGDLARNTNAPRNVKIVSR